MGEKTNIEWCDMTWNPWIGCAKVHEGCANCYAETMMDKRYGRAKWGVNGTRVRTSAANWKEPLKWNREAEKSGERKRVFCASLADVFEDRPELEAWRRDLFTLIVSTPHLDWLLLTKRPESIRDMWPAGRLPNVWLGTSVSNQPSADKQIPALLRCSDLCRFTFLSIEPLLGWVNLTRIPFRGDTDYVIDALAGRYGQFEPSTIFSFGMSSMRPLDLVIVGGESGPGARPMHPDWVRDLRGQCVNAGVAFHFKQWGAYKPFNRQPDDEGEAFQITSEGKMLQADALGRLPAIPEGTVEMVRMGKKEAGRILDGRTWDEYPDTSALCVNA